ncbi:MAG TPA: GWxTD domain-containing protein [Candidatus Sulfotelmatobacter sp.]|nr:GWxTD domain-containing protein [Candidatus Sulfotelmatobacter sp.]
MFPVAWKQSFLRVLLVSAALVTAGAFAQTNDSQDQKSAQKPADASAVDKATADKPAKDTANASQAQPTDEAQDPLKRPPNAKQKKKNERALKVELSKPYKKWLEEDVVYIITDEERAAFRQLSNDEERDNFIEAFWQRRDPTPDTEENEYKEEHYQRIAYANEHFAAGVPGWKTDRGRIYIVYGKPDEIDSHPSGGTYERPMEEGGGETSTFPFEDWRYRYIEGIGQEIIIEFVDTCMCGEFHMTLDRSEKDALLMTPNAGLTQWEQMGMSTKAQRFQGGGLERLGLGPDSATLQTKEFDRLEQFAKLQQAPQVKFKDLEEIVNSKVILNPMPFDVHVDFVKVTSDTALVPITIQMKNRDITFVNKDGVQRGTANIFARLSTLTGKVVQTFEDTVQVDVPAELLPRTAENASVYYKALPLRPGRYKLNIAVKDVNGDRKGAWSRSIVVPDYSDDKLSTSTLIVADQMEPVPTKAIGTGNFVIGTMKVRPRVPPADGKPALFKRDKDQKLNFWMQVYNLGLDEKTHKPSATFEYDIVNVATNKAVVQKTESTDTMGNISEQVTLQKSIVTANLQPGVYKIEIKVNDNISKQTIDPSAVFAVE